jgi:eukaryotic-like serine/threonine-protein kinase
MAVAQSLVGMTLKGQRFGPVWQVLEKIERTEKNYGGLFSVGYRARNAATGDFAFLKATDLDLLTEEEGSSFDRMAAAIKMHGFERKIVEHCKGNNMDRIVTPLDFGDTVMVGANGVKEPLFWITFEWADSDGKMHRTRVQKYDFVWVAKAMHNLAIAVSQLHQASICHNDIKPSNVLVFKEYLQKLGDLGRAISPDFECPHSLEVCLGDPRYASPELLYQHQSINLGDLRWRKANDLYLLGSVGYFFVTGTMLSPTILSQMQSDHRPFSLDGGWGDGFESVLPHWRSAHAKAIGLLESSLPEGLLALSKDYGQEFVVAISQLTEADPCIRGHPSEAANGQSYSVQRYISLFDKLSLVAARPN